MPRWHLKLLFYSVPARFPSAFGLEESVERLRSASAPWYTWALTSQQAVGSVTKDRVSLVRVRPFIRNDFKPQFVGHFIEVDGIVTLAGKFSMRLWTKVFMSFWLGFCLLWTLGTSLAVLFQPDSPGFLPLAGLGMCAFGVILVQAGKTWARADIDWLSEIIQSSIGRAT
jgi:hypothetical protein